MTAISRRDCNIFLPWHAAIAGKDITRLKWNWLFVSLVVTIRALNHSAPLPTNHQFIINPTIDNLNITSKVKFCFVSHGFTIAIFALGHSTRVATDRSVLFSDLFNVLHRTCAYGTAWRVPQQQNSDVVPLHGNYRATYYGLFFVCAVA